MTSSGTAGTLDIYAESALLLGADGDAIDGHGNVYVANVFYHNIMRVNRDRSVEVVVDDLELFKPLSLVFGSTSGEHTSLFITNCEGCSQPFPGEPREVADVVMANVCVKGQPVR